jgi:hypothetical protein
MGKAFKESRVVLTGNISDPEVKERARKLKASGRKVETISREDHDTGVGPCGKHYCSCQAVCKDHYASMPAKLI